MKWLQRQISQQDLSDNQQNRSNSNKLIRNKKTNKNH